MEKYVEQCLIIINNAIMKRNLELLDLSEEEWGELYEIMKHNAMFALCYKYTNEIAKDAGIPNQILNRWKNDTFAAELYNIVRKQELVKIIQDAKENNINFVLFKGIFLQNMYDDKNGRISSDVDLFIFGDKRDQALAFFKQRGYKWIEQKDNVDILKNEGIITIELHTRLWEDLTGSRIEVLESYKFEQKEQLLEFQIENTSIQTLSYTQHFIYQLYHIAKHFSFECIGMKYLVDISMFYNLYKDKIDKNLFREIIEKTKMKEFVGRLFQLCSYYFYMDQSALETIDFEPEQVDMDELLNLFIRKELSNEENRWDAVGVIKPYFCDERQVEKNGIKRYRNMIFPDIRQMTMDYPYVRKCKILVAFAWMQRGISFARRKNKEKLSVSKKLKKADEQLEKMKKMRLIK